MGDNKCTEKDHGDESEHPSDPFHWAHGQDNQDDETDGEVPHPPTQCAVLIPKGVKLLCDHSILFAVHDSGVLA